MFSEQCSYHHWRTIGKCANPSCRNPVCYECRKNKNYLCGECKANGVVYVHRNRLSRGVKRKSDELQGQNSTSTRPQQIESGRHRSRTPTSQTETRERYTDIRKKKERFKL